MNPANQLIATAFAHRQLPREACGLVIVERGKEVFVPCQNISPYQDAFEIDPVDYAKAEDRGAIIEVFHSHCYASPRPSDIDLVACEATGVPWSIVSVPNGDWFTFQPTGYRAPLVGRQWAHGLLDCYSLIRDYFRETLSIEIPDFDREDNWWIKGQNLYLENYRSAGFVDVPIDQPRVHDVLLLQMRSPVVNHGGIYIGNDLMLHQLHRRLSCREVFGGYYRKNCVKVLRHESL